MATTRKPTREPLPPLVRQLGWVSFFTDAASELLYPLIPIFLTTVLGAPVIALGLVEGLADGVATGLKVLTGYIADRVGEHRKMVRFGYTLSALSKPIMGLAPAWGWVVALRVSDRIGKAVRGVPRDLMLAEAVPAEDRGRAFGFHRAMDSAGAVVGPLLAVVGILIFGSNHLRPVFLLALIPGLASIMLLRRLPRTTRPAGKKWEPTPLPWRGPYGAFLVVTAVFSIANSSDAFLLLRAKNLGLSIIQVILAYAVYNVLYTLLSYPAGTYSDRPGRRVSVYGVGLFAFAAVYAGFALVGSAGPVWPLLAVYGIYMAFTDGISRALVVDLVPDNVRGKALGVHQALTGACVLIAGITAGILWDTVSPAAPFVVGAVGSLLAGVLLVTTVRMPAKAAPS
jgi:MFS family permease